MADEPWEQTVRVCAPVTDGKPTTIPRVVPCHLGVELFDVVQWIYVFYARGCIRGLATALPKEEPAHPEEHPVMA